MARRLNPGSLAAVGVAVALIVVIAGSYLVSSRMNRDAEKTGNSASAPYSPGRINEQPLPDRGTPSQRQQPLVDTNVPPAAAQR
jgi:hypothetical protein